ncbi:MAG: protein nirF, partial [Rhodobacteraceae bacterium]|nr:protein nirF [Paracoccaceae bacterium]
MKILISVLALALAIGIPAKSETMATGDLGLIVERAKGAVILVDQSERAALARIEGLGDLSHASLVYSADERYAYVFGRDGGLTKVDIVERRIAARVVQAGNSIGGAISD